jgi:hypothetical protein
MKGVKDDFESVRKGTFIFTRWYTHHRAAQSIQGLEECVQGRDRLFGSPFPLQASTVETNIPISEFVDEQEQSWYHRIQAIGSRGLLALAKHIDSGDSPAISS